MVLGKTFAELGGSEYFAHLGLFGNLPPRVDGEQARKTYRALERAIGKGLVRSAHDISDGGIGICLAEGAFAGGLGADVDLSLVPQAGVFRDDYLLFSESQSRFIITARETDMEALRRVFRGLPFGVIGRVTKEPRLSIRGVYGERIVDMGTALLKEAWLAPFKKLFG